MSATASSQKNKPINKFVVFLREKIEIHSVEQEGVPEIRAFYY